MKLSTRIISSVALLSLVISPALAQEVITNGQVRADFKTFTAMGYPEQDVYISGPTAANPSNLFDQVFRVSGHDAENPTNLIKTVFTSLTPVDHDVRKAGANLGPFPRGKRSTKLLPTGYKQTVVATIRLWAMVRTSTSYSKIFFPARPTHSGATG
jgi:hypothetical protein